jgi:hypothetical protein
MHRASLRSAAAIALTALAAGAMAACNRADVDRARPESTRPAPGVGSSAIVAATAPPTATPPAGTATVGSTPADGICMDDTPVVAQDIGSVNTIVVPANAADFEVVVVPRPDVACPGDVVGYDVAVRNTTGAPSTFAPNRGLLFVSGGMANWSLAQLGPVTIEPGATWTTMVTAPIPPVRPGVYAIRPEGIAAVGSVTVLDPGASAD